MTTGAGYKSKTAWRKEAAQGAYGTPIECGANHQVPLVSESLAREIEKELDNVIRHKAGYGGSDLLGKLVAGGISIEAVYRGIESIICSALGFSNYSASPETIAAGVYKHTFELAEHLHTESWAAGDGILAGSGYLAGDNKIRRGTLCADKTISIWEYISAMINSITIKGNSKGISIELGLVPYNLDRASAVNTSSAAWTIPNSDWESILFQDMVLWIDDYSAGTALTDADAVGISEFEIKLENNLKVEKDSLSGLYIAEPRREGKRLLTGSFTFPRYESDTFLAHLDDQTAQMAMLRFVGSQIGATGYYNTLWIWLPTLKFDKVAAPLNGPGMLTVTHEFTCELPAAVPSGFPTQAEKELLIQIQNDLDTNPLI
ncbi:MAG: phage tail tube protein [Planctomycetota bacterium]